jgi:uncharacterized pyridoxamine 5'-phosphate oxidase family protein
MDEVYEFLKKCKVFYVATEDGDQPRVRPFGAIGKFEDKIYIQTGKVKDVSKQMKANPKVEICAFDGDTDWVRITAKVVLDERIEAQEAVLDANPGLKKMYAAGDGNNEVYYLDDATATFSSFVKEPHTVTF